MFFQIHAKLHKGQILSIFRLEWIEVRQFSFKPLQICRRYSLSQNEELSFFNFFDFDHFWPFFDIWIPKNNQFCQKTAIFKIQMSKNGQIWSKSKILKNENSSLWPKEYLQQIWRGLNENCPTSIHSSLKIAKIWPLWDFACIWKNTLA